MLAPLGNAKEYQTYHFLHPSYGGGLGKEPESAWFAKKYL